jgi:hypothetical protein
LVRKEITKNIKNINAKISLLLLIMNFLFQMFDCLIG